MKRIAITTLVGGLLGAIEGGVVFCILFMIESREGFIFGDVTTWIFLILIMGLVYGIIFGGIIGILVALLRARATTGLAVGIGLGLMVIPVLLILDFPPDYIMSLLVMAAMLCGGSIGLATGLITSRAEMNSSE